MKKKPNKITFANLLCRLLYKYTKIIPIDVRTAEKYNNCIIITDKSNKVQNIDLTSLLLTICEIDKFSCNY